MHRRCCGHSSRRPPPRRPNRRPVTFRVEVDYVEVDALVADAQGNLVSDLRAEDFEVLEDGKPQKVSTSRW